MDPTGVQESSELQSNVTLKSCGVTSTSESSDDNAFKSTHGEGDRVRFPPFTDVGDAGGLNATGSIVRFFQLW